ncbi:hypothetical protein D805_1814 [Bifidobacterium thermophilum RBL67]|uniref:Uncharacterized protein n=1 Tax=Bifidobacterium thermophilum RBL67 TaxID=1254439 RepID=M4REW5_9BIFI|nr:hypothetical protein D805_1814 [Bifidobacterium thermophilum RBL67]
MYAGRAAPASLVVWYVLAFSLSQDACRVHCARKQDLRER